MRSNPITTIKAVSAECFTDFIVKIGCLVFLTNDPVLLFLHRFQSVIKASLCAVPNFGVCYIDDFCLEAILL